MKDCYSYVILKLYRYAAKKEVNVKSSYTWHSYPLEGMSMITNFIGVQYRYTYNINRPNLMF